MTSLADGLPPEIAAHVHPDWRKNEREYWANREAIRAQYEGLWVAYADGNVVASGKRPVEIYRAAHLSQLHPFVIRVGAECEPTRMRSAAFSYDGSYQGEAMPQISVEVRTASGTPGVILDRVIPDTGADASAVPLSDCQTLGLDLMQGVPSLIGGVGGSIARILTF